MRKINSIGVFLFIIQMSSMGYCVEIPVTVTKPDFNVIQKTIKHLSDEIGPRPAGTEQATQAVEYISGELKKMGYYPTYQAFKLPDGRLGQTVHAYNGTTTSQHEIILGVHLDTVPGSPGANDDGSGIAVLLELARVLKSRHSSMGIHFLFLGAEEKVPGYDEGLYFSSSKYLDYQKGLGLDFLKGVILLDRVGVGDKLYILQVEGTKTELTDRVVAIAKESNIPLERKVEKRWQPVMPFEDAGLATAWLEWGPDRNQHTPKDTPDKISREKIETVFELVEKFILTEH